MPLTPADKLSKQADLCYTRFVELISEDGAIWNTLSFMERLRKRQTHIMLLNHVRKLDKLRTHFWQRENRIIDYK